jgi:ABC-2 type transport system permease protein
MAVREIISNFKLFVEYQKIFLKSAIEYRANFLLSTFFMFLNDVIWLFFWYLIYYKLGDINGWVFQDLIYIYVFATISFGIAGYFFGNHKEIAELVVKGKLDFYLTLPKKDLTHILISKNSWFDLGDLLFGILLLLFMVSVTKVPLILLMIIPGVLILIGFGILVGSLSFYLQSSESFGSTLYESLISISLYPGSIFTGATKFITLFILPAGFITAVPVQLLHSFDVTWFILLFLFSIALFLLAIYVFYKGLKKYESGNLLYVRM